MWLLVPRVSISPVAFYVQASYEYIGSNGSIWTLKTNAEAPRYRVQRVDISAATPMWEDVVPQHAENLLQWAVQIGEDKVVLAYLCNVQVRMY